jgi:glycine reductase
MILNQIQAGVGTKEDIHVPLTATKEALGPGVMMKPLLEKYQQQLIVTIYCGTGTYEENKEVVQRKINGMLKRLDVEAVICGPSYDYKEFSMMCAELAESIEENGTAKVVCAMSEERSEVIQAYKDKVTIVKMPKKGAAGLNSALENICKTLEVLENSQTQTHKEKYIY